MKRTSNEKNVQSFEQCMGKMQISSIDFRFNGIFGDRISNSIMFAALTPNRDGSSMEERQCFRFSWLFLGSYRRIFDSFQSSSRPWIRNEGSSSFSVYISRLSIFHLKISLHQKNSKSEWLYENQITITSHLKWLPSFWKKWSIIWRKFHQISTWKWKLQKEINVRYPLHKV